MKLYYLIEQIDKHRQEFEALDLRKAVVKARTETAKKTTENVAQFLAAFRNIDLELDRRQANGHRIKSAVCSCGCSFYSTGEKICPECRLIKMQEQV